MILLNDFEVPIERFPNGETKLKDFSELINTSGKNVLRYRQFRFNDDYVHGYMVKYFMDQKGYPVTAFFDYFPYARMDRRVEEELPTVEPITKIVNYHGYEEVIVVEPHSKRTMELLERARAVYPIRNWLPKIMKEIGFSGSDYIVVPDKGAKERYGDLKGVNMCVLNKVRDPLTKEITEMRLDEGSVITPGAICIIIDDICAKGSTALRAASVLKSLGASKIALVVTHIEETALQGNVLSKKSPFFRVYASTSCMDEERPILRYMPINVSDYINLD